MRRRPLELWCLALAVPVMAAGLVVTFSRSSALMLMLGLRPAGRPGRRSREGAAVTGAALLIVLGGAAAAPSGNVRHAAHQRQPAGAGQRGPLRPGAGRAHDLARQTRSPAPGSGAFEKRFEQTLTPVEQRRVRVVISHNAPVTVLSEQGVIGFALFLILVVGTGWAAVRGSWQEGDIGWARWTLGAMLAGILVHSLLYAALFEDPFTWIVAAAAVSLAARRAHGPAAAPEPTAPQPLPVT